MPRLRHLRPAHLALDLFDVVIYSPRSRIVAYTHPKEPSDG